MTALSTTQYSVGQSLFCVFHNQDQRMTLTIHKAGREWLWIHSTLRVSRESLDLYQRGNRDDGWRIIGRAYLSREHRGDVDKLEVEWQRIKDEVFRVSAPLSAGITLEKIKKIRDMLESQ